MARDFDGTTGYLSYSGVTLTAMPLTMACWFNADNITADHTLMGIGPSTGNGRLSLEASGSVASDPIRARSFTTGGTAVAASSSAGFSASTWHHACGTYGGNTSRAAFLDGANKGTNTTSNDPAAASWNVVTIGTRIFSGSPGLYLDGRAAECGLWNVVLDDDEVAALARGYSPLLIRPASLVGYWPVQGAVSPEPELKNRYAGTLAGTANESDHPRILMPKGARIYFHPAAAPGGLFVNPLLGRGGSAAIPVAA